MPKIVRKGSYTRTQAENDQQELRRIKDAKKQLDAREAEIKKRLGDWMETALTPDSSGHYLLTVLNENGEPIHLQRQARRKITVNTEVAIPWLKKKGFADAVVEKEIVAKEVTQDQILDALMSAGYEEYIDRETIIDEQYLAQLVEQGEIELSDFEKLCNVDITYAMTYIEDKKLQESKESGRSATKGNRETIQDHGERDTTRTRAVPHRKARK